PILHSTVTTTTELCTLSLHDALPISRLIDDVDGRGCPGREREMNGKPHYSAGRAACGCECRWWMSGKCGCLCVSAAWLCRCSCRSEEHTSELQSRENLVCRLLLEKKK